MKSTEEQNQVLEQPKLTSSKRKIEANRENAKKSTGPRSVRGKRNIRHNALKHGLLAGELICSGKYCKEDPEEFSVFLIELIVHYEAVGLYEEELVGRIALEYLKLRRADRAEVGAIQLRSISIPFRASESSTASIDALLPFLPHGRDQLFRSSAGIVAVISTLDRAKFEMTTYGAPSVNTREALVRCFGDQVALLRAREVGQEETDKVHSTSEGNELAKTSQRWLPRIEQRRADCVKVKEYLEIQHESEIDAEIAAASIPPKAVVKNIARYTREIRNQIDWYEGKLADAQARRKAAA